MSTNRDYTFEWKILSVGIAVGRFLADAKQLFPETYCDYKPHSGKLSIHVPDPPGRVLEFRVEDPYIEIEAQLATWLEWLREDYSNIAKPGEE